MDKFDIECVDNVIDTIKRCDAPIDGHDRITASYCDDCKYHDFGHNCLRVRNRDILFILTKVKDLMQENKDLQLYALKTTLNRIYGWPDDYKTAPIPDNIEKMLAENVQAWKDWATELREAKLRGLREEIEQRQQELKIGGWNNEFHKPEGFQGTSGSN